MYITQFQKKKKKELHSAKTICKCFISKRKQQHETKIVWYLHTVFPKSMKTPRNSTKFLIK